MFALRLLVRIPSWIVPFDSYMWFLARFKTTHCGRNAVSTQYSVSNLSLSVPGIMLRCFWNLPCRLMHTIRVSCCASWSGHWALKCFALLRASIKTKPKEKSKVRCRRKLQRTIPWTFTGVHAVRITIVRTVLCCYRFYIRMPSGERTVFAAEQCSSEHCSRVLSGMRIRYAMPRSVVPNRRHVQADNFRN